MYLMCFYFLLCLERIIKMMMMMITWRLFSILSILSCFRSYYSVLPLKVNKVVQNVPEKTENTFQNKGP